MPVHKPIATTTFQSEGEKTIPVKTFQFLDDGPWAKVYLPFDRLDTISKENLSTEFTETSFAVFIRGLEPLTLEFKVAKLYGKIVPEECFAKVMKTKVLIKLKKALKEPKADEEAESKVDEPDAALADLQADMKASDAPDDVPELVPAEEAPADATEDSKPEEGAAEEVVTKQEPQPPTWYKLRAD